MKNCVCFCLLPRIWGSLLPLESNFGVGFQMATVGGYSSESSASAADESESLL